MKVLHAAILLAVTAGCTTPEMQFAELEKYNGQKLDDNSRESLARSYEKISGESLACKKGGFEPWWVKKFESGPAGWLLLLVHPGYETPDISCVEAHVFDPDWIRIARHQFVTGYRLFLTGADVKRPDALAQDVLVIQTTYANPSIGKGKAAAEFQREYYAFAGDKIGLVRLEDHQGRLVRNWYKGSAPDIGPAPPQRTKDEWIASLSSADPASADPAKQLYSLVWLTGSHLPSSAARRKDVSQESMEDSALYESVRDDPRTAKILEALKQHKNPWIRDYADLGTCASE